MFVTSHTFAVLRAVLIGSVFAATASGETAMTVIRCTADLDGDGVYHPVLQVAVNGETHVHRVGSDGLTRTIVFNSQAAIDWAVGVHAADASDVIYDVCFVTGGGAAAITADTGTGGGEDTNTGGGEDTGAGGEECGPCGCYSQDSASSQDATLIGPADRFATV